MWFCSKTPCIVVFYHLHKWHMNLWYEFITYFTGKYKNIFLHQAHTMMLLGDRSKALQNISPRKLILKQAIDISFLVIFYFGLTIAVIFLVCPANCCNHHSLVISLRKRLLPFFSPVEFLEWKHHFIVSSVMCFRGRN